MSPRVSKEIKELSRVSKEEWREYTKTVWQIATIRFPQATACSCATFGSVMSKT